MALEIFTRTANYMLVGAVNAIRKDLRAGSKMKEPDYLAAIVTKFPLLMNTMWGNAKYGGCYIHQRPYVTTKVGNHTCEAGDLLVLCRRKEENETRINAALFQLKMAKRHYRSICPDNQIQYELYTDWPEFSIGRKYDPAETYNIEPKTVTSGAQYLFINVPWGIPADYDDFEYCAEYPPLFTHSIPEPFMSNQRVRSFGRFLWNFIHWQTGRPIAPNEELANDDWSRFIWDLIAKTQNAKISNINVGIQKKHGIRRQQGDFFQFMSTDDCICHLPQDYYNMHENSDEGEPPVEEKIINEGYDGAISILFIDL